MYVHLFIDACASIHRCRIYLYMHVHLFGVILESLWDHFGVALRTLGSLWNHFGYMKVAFGSLCSVFKKHSFSPKILMIMHVHLHLHLHLQCQNGPKTDRKRTQTVAKICSNWVGPAWIGPVRAESGSDPILDGSMCESNMFCRGFCISKKSGTRRNPPGPTIGQLQFLSICQSI